MADLVFPNREGLVNVFSENPPLATTTSLSEVSDLMEYISNLEGYKTRIKNSHWSAASLSLHVELDSTLDIVSDYQDVMAEISQRIYGQIRENTFRSNPQTQITIKDWYTDLRRMVVTFHTKYKDNNEFIGIINATEDFLQEFDQSIYRINLALRALEQ